MVTHIMMTIFLEIGWDRIDGRWIRVALVTHITVTIDIVKSGLKGIHVHCKLSMVRVTVIVALQLLQISEILPVQDWLIIISLMLLMLQ